MKKTRPLLSVLLPVFNAQETVGRAMQSILAQTFHDFELLVVNDGSEDGSLEAVKKFCDPRIEIIDLKRNCGLVAALNCGLEAARGDLIARQDADDESLPARLQLQCAALSNNSKLVAVGAALRIMRNESATGEVWKYPASAAGARWQSLFKTPVAHSAVMYRRKPVVECGGYSDEYKCAEDYELWSRLLEIGDIRSLSNILVGYDVGIGGVSRTRANEQRRVHCRIAGNNMQRLSNSRIESDVIELLSFGVEDFGVLQEFSRFQRAVNVFASLYQTFLATERALWDGEMPSEVRLDMEERACKIVRMLPYRERLRGLNCILTAMPKRSFSSRSIASMLLFP